MQNNDKPIVYFDLESSGLEPQHEITQFAASAYTSTGIPIDKLEVKIKFDESKADPEALKINHYDREVWAKEAVEPKEAAKIISKWLKRFAWVEMISKKTNKPFYVAQLCGYNASVYDAPKLREFFKALGEWLPASLMVLDVMQLVMWFYHVNPELRPENLKLSTVCTAFGIEITNAHEAMSDVDGTAQLALKINNPASY